jgi:hypothetical protein
LFVINPLLSFIPSLGFSRQGFIVDQTYATHCPSQEIFLLGGWVKAKLVSTFSHVLHFNTNSVKPSYKDGVLNPKCLIKSLRS